MTPQEKAGVMMFNFYSKISGIKVINLPANLITQMSGDSHFKTAKECALVCVDEILNGAHVWNKIEGKDRTFWNEVKIEIQNY